MMTGTFTQTGTHTVRWAVRPKPTTIAGWYVWAVMVDEFGNESWAPLPAHTVETKREAHSIKTALNEKLAIKLGKI